MYVTFPSGEVALVSFNIFLHLFLFLQACQALLKKQDKFFYSKVEKFPTCVSIEFSAKMSENSNPHNENIVWYISCAW